MTPHDTVGWLAAVLVAVGSTSGAAQTSTEELKRVVDQLGDFDYEVRLGASREVRRADPELVGPVLRDAAVQHEDSYVQFRALVLLYGVFPEGAGDAFEDALSSTNDRVRAAAYDYFEHAPDPAIAPKLVAALETETSEFVRPALVRALAAHDDDPTVRSRLVRDIDSGEGFFRGAVIEALGDYGATYAVDSLVAIAEDPGSLQDDALLALGKIGDERAVDAMASVQDDASDTLQPIVSATACLLGIDCERQLRYVIDALSYGAQITDGDSQRLLRSAAAGLAALAMRRNQAALDALFEIGVASEDPARAPIALALGTVALRQPDIVRSALEGRSMPDAELLLLRDAFDMLDEDLAEERFYSRMRQSYWDAADGSAARAFAETALRVLEF